MHVTASAVGSPSAFGQQRWVPEAFELGEAILKLRRRAANGQVGWVGAFGGKDSGEPARSLALGPHLYGGIAGIALFLAALASVEGSGETADAALEAIQPLRNKLSGLAKERERAEKLSLSIGGLHGVCSFIYSFLKIGTIMSCPDLVQEATALLSLLTERRISADASYDVASGSAGAILVLLALDRALAERGESDERALACALVAADHLMASRQGANLEGPRAWQTMAELPPLTGFAHGASGIAYALGKLGTRAGRTDLLDAACEALAYERLCFDSRYRNWKDLRYPELTFGYSWCHGAPGIALARAGLFDVAGEEAVEDLRIALETTRSEGRFEVDHLCCGNLGRAEILRYAGERLGEAALLAAADQIVEEVVERARPLGRFRLSPPEAGLSDPSLFTGAAGVGYTLLRFSGIDHLPNVLLLE